MQEEGCFPPEADQPMAEDCPVARLWGGDNGMIVKEEESGKNESGPGAAPEAAVALSPKRKAVEELRGMVQRSNRRWKRLIVIETMAWLIAIPLGYLWLVFFLDNTVHLPVIGRILASAMFFLGLAGLLIRCLRQWRQA